MVTTNGAPRARVLAAKLRASREASKMGVREVARKLGVSHSVISYWETGKRSPGIEDVASYLTAINVTGDEKEWILDLARCAADKNWLTAGISGIAISQAAAAVVECERAATTITEWSQNVVPGLLQTSDYTRAIMSANGQTPTDELEVRVMIRASRRDVLTRPDPVRLEALIGESALRDSIGSRTVMVAQLRYLIKLASWDNVTIRVLRSGHGWHPGMAGSFVLYNFENLPSIVFLEHHRSSVFVYEADVTGEYKSVGEWVRRLALSPEESLKLINETVEEMERKG
jgi:transcriptional regulator with XRE-family HTH domain